MQNAHIYLRLAKGFLCWVLLCCSAFGQDDAAASKLRVGIKEAPPYAMKDEAGEWQGIAVDLWRLVAADLKTEFTFLESSLPELLEGVERADLDVGIGAITVSADREKVLDFSQPFDHSGIGVATRIGDHRFSQLIRSIVSFDFLKAVAALCLVLALAGAVVWHFERKQNAEHFGGGPLAGIGNGFWWAAVTMTTVGYGDKAPTTTAGRITALIWMFVGVITISGFTAAIASTLTASNLRSNLRGPSDLSRVQIGAVSGTAGSEALKARGLNFRPFTTYQNALDKLASGNLSAVVHDQPLLIYHVRENHQGNIEVLHWLVTQQSYAFAIPTDSPLREPLNRSLLKVMSGPEWSEIRRRYLGSRHEN